VRPGTERHKMASARTLAGQVQAKSESPRLGGFTWSTVPAPVRGERRTRARMQHHSR